MKPVARASRKCAPRDLVGVTGSRRDRRKGPKGVSVVARFSRVLGSHLLHRKAL